MTHSPTKLALIGRGRIGRDVTAQLAGLPGYCVEAILGHDARRLPQADITIDMAGPDALRQFGEEALSHGDLWTVGAAALIDPDLRDRLDRAALQSGHRIQLFTGWISGPLLCPPGLPAKLFVRQYAPGLADRPGPVFRGPLAEAAGRFPDHLNTAMASAICGPGIDATHITLISTPEGGAHRIAARFVMPGQTIRTDIRFDRPGPHPVALAILAALARRTAPLALGGC
jgi:aspartate dehydrogenase